jgi:hypothetical protein
MKSNWALIAASTVLLGVAAVHAQPAAIQQLQNSQAQLQMPSLELRAGTNAPELYVGENDDIGPQRILKVKGQSAVAAPRREWLDIMLDSQVFYSDNANFGSADNRIRSAVFVNTAQLAIAPTPFDLGSGKFAPAVGFSSQWYNYSSDQMSPLDFDAHTAFVNLRYFLGNWQFSLGANYTRLLSQNGYEETYREWLPNYTIQRVIPVNDKIAIILGNVIDYHFTHIPTPFTGYRDDLNDHFDDMAFLSVNWQLSSKFAVQPFYRFQYSLYPNDTASATLASSTQRNDYLSTVGITFLYSFNQHASVRAFCSYNTKSSDDQLTPHYDEINGGIGASLNIRF